MAVPTTVFKGRDNASAFLLKANGEAADLRDVTRVELRNPEYILSSESHDYFAWDEGSGVLHMTLGRVGAFTAGKDYKFNLIVYELGNPHGINWGVIKVLVK